MVKGGLPLIYGIRKGNQVVMASKSQIRLGSDKNTD